MELHGKQMLWDFLPIISHLWRLQSSDRFLRLFGLTARDLFLIEYWYYGTKWHLVFISHPTPPPSAIQFSLVGYFEDLTPSILLVWFFSLVGGKLQTFMNSLIKVPPSECRLKVSTPESSKPMNIYTENQQMNTLYIFKCKSSHGFYLILGLTFY